MQPAVALLPPLSVGRAMHDLDELGLLLPAVAPTGRHEHAVVLGGSWTGMLTAAVLSPYFHRVTVLERDTVAATLHNPSGLHRGVPHGAQSHIVLPYAVRFVNALLPSFQSELQAQGAHVDGDMGVHFRWYQRGGWRPQQRLGLPMWFASRALLENTLRRHILATFTNVQFHGDALATGFVPAAAGHIGGVRLRRGDQDEVLAVDFVADCMGKHSRAGRWLGALGVRRVRDITVDAKTFYATGSYQRADDAVRDQGHWAMALHGHTGHDHFAGAITVEKNAMLVWAVRAGTKPPGDMNALHGFLKDLEVPDFYNHVTDEHHTLRENGGVTVFSAGPARRRAYERTWPPPNFVALGDAACATDPAFGLGLSLAASTVASLAAALHRRVQHSTPDKPWSMRGFGRELAKRVAWRTYLPWLLTAAEDYRFPHTRGPHRGSLWVRLLQIYIDRAFKAAHHDAQVDAMVLRVVGLVTHPMHVFGPLIFSRVLHSYNMLAEVTDECSIEANVGSR